jgi:hypothetical protein
MAASIRRRLRRSSSSIPRRPFQRFHGGKWNLSWATWVTPATAGRPLGYMAQMDWASTVEVLKTYGAVTGVLEPAQLYTNEFVPTGNEYIPPQT